MGGLRLISTLVLFCSYVACSAGSESKYEHFQNEGNKYFANNKYQEALIAWEKALTYEGGTPDLFQKIGIANFRMGNLPRAEKFFQKTIELNPSAFEAWRKIGEIRMLFEDIPAADKIWEIIQAGIKVDPEDYIFHGDLLALHDELHEAEQAYREALAIEPDNHSGMVKLAICLFTQNRKSEADEVFGRLTALCPTQAEILLQMANYCKLSKRLEKADQYYSQVIAAEPAIVGHRLNAAELYIGNSQNEKALDVLRPVVGKTAMNRPAKKLLADLLMSLDQMNDAERLLDQLEQERKSDADVLMLKGKFHLLAKNPALAVMDYQAVIEIRPQFPEAHYWLGISYLLGGHDRLGVQSLINALSIDNDYSDAEIAIADFYYKKKDYKLASKHSLRVIEKNQDNFRAYMIMGNVYLAQELFDDAVEMFQRAEAISPGSTRAKYFKGVALERGGKNNDALSIYSQILQNKPNLIDVSKRYAELLIHTDQLPKAIEYFEELTKNDSKNGYAYHFLGQVCLAAGQTEKAINAFYQSISTTPMLGASYIKLSQIYEENKQTQKQKDILERAIRYVPQFSYAYTQLALLYKAENRYQEAIRLLEDGYDSDPDNPFLANDLASLYLDSDIKPIKALELAKFAYEKMPEHRAFADTLGWAYCKRGIYNMAIWYLKSALNSGALQEGYALKNSQKIKKSSNKVAIEEGDESAVIHYHLGVAFLRSGQTKNATMHIEQALKRGLDGEDKASAYELLTQMRTNPDGENLN